MFHDPAFMLYAMECEGELDTYQGKRNKLIKDLRSRVTSSMVNEFTVCREAAAAGLGTLSDEEINDILREVNMG